MRLLAARKMNRFSLLDSLLDAISSAFVTAPHTEIERLPGDVRAQLERDLWVATCLTYFGGHVYALEAAGRRPLFQERVNEAQSMIVSDTVRRCREALAAEWETADPASVADLLPAPQDLAIEDGDLRESPWAYSGKIFALSEDGDTYVIRAGREYELLGVNSLDEFTMATPAIAQGSLFIRTASKLYRIREGG